MLDDGTGKIISNVFEESPVIDKIIPGNVILCIGKVRTYNQEKYIAPEILKIISQIWLKVRHLEIPKPKINYLRKHQK